MARFGLTNEDLADPRGRRIADVAIADREGEEKPAKRTMRSNN